MFQSYQKLNQRHQYSESKAKCILRDIPTSNIPPIERSHPNINMIIVPRMLWQLSRFPKKTTRSCIYNRRHFRAYGFVENVVCVCGFVCARAQQISAPQESVQFVWVCLPELRSFPCLHLQVDFPINCAASVHIVLRLRCRRSTNRFSAKAENAPIPHTTTQHNNFALRLMVCH